MNTPEFEHPELTAYALGELSPAEAASVRRLIEGSPELRAEYERVERTVAALKAVPPLPRRSLSQRQRETILSVGQPAARNANARVVPFVRPVRRGFDFTRAVAGLAAAACIAWGAFVLGQHFASRSAPPELPVVASTPAAALSETVAVSRQPGAVPEAEAGAFEAVQQPPRVAPALVAVAAAAPVPAPAPAAPQAGSVAPAAPASVAAAPAPVAAPRPAPPTAVPVNALKAFTLASVQAESSIALRPQLMRVAPKPVPREFAGQILAAPAPDRPKPAPKAPALRKPEPQPQLIIHSWKAEIASCPWNPSRRLMRFVAQIPVEQDGVESNARDYQIAVKFDSSQVQAWRLITEKHMPPSNGGSLATRFAWYEIVPGRNFAPKPDKPSQLGTLEIVQPRGAARDSQPLRLLDRGLAWNEAREDFVFETAMVGFNLLLQGTENVGSLNHRLVLELAEQSRDEDPKGERAKFIGAVKQAQRAAGL